VLGASIGRVKTRDIFGEKTTGKLKRLKISIRIKIKNLSKDKKLSYTGWAGAGLRARHYAKLGDEHANSCARVTSGITSRVEGQVVKRTAIAPGKALDDLLVFERPVEAARELRLELPLEAAGRKGKLHLLIRKDQVEIEK